MRQIAAIASLLLGTVPVALAQHGGGGRGGGGHASGGAHGGVSGAGHPVSGAGHLPVGPGRSAFTMGHLPAGPGSVGRAYGGVNPYRFAYGAGGVRTGMRPGSPYTVSSGRLGYGFNGVAGVRGSNPYGFHGGRSFYPGRSGVGLHFFYPGLAYPAFVDFGFLNPYWNYADLYNDDQQAGLAQEQPDAYGQNSPYGYAPQPYTPEGETPNPNEANAYPAEPGPYGAGEPYLPPPRAAGGDQPMVYAPYAYNGLPPYAAPSPQVTVVTVAPPQREEDAVTLFFRDGRPPEQIRNYALTRTSLLITSPRLREIPLTDLDLALTERVNHAAGVDFRLPEGR